MGRTGLTRLCCNHWIVRTGIDCPLTLREEASASLDGGGCHIPIYFHKQELTLKKSEEKMKQKIGNFVCMILMLFVGIFLCGGRDVRAAVSRPTVRCVEQVTSLLNNPGELNMDSVVRCELSAMASEVNGDIVSYDGYVGIALKFTTSDEKSYYHMKLANESQKYNIYFQLYDEYKLKIEDAYYSASEATGEEAYLGLKENSVYYIVIYVQNSRNLSKGEVTFFVEQCIDDCADTYGSSAKLVKNNTMLNGRIDGYSDVDAYCFITGTSKAYYNIAAWNTDISGGMKVLLYDIQGTLVDTVASSLPENTTTDYTYILDSNQTYYILFSGRLSTDMGDYKLRVSCKLDEFGDNVYTSSPIIFNTDYTGCLQSDEDIDVLSFNSGAVTKCTVNINNKSENKISYSITDRAGNKVDSGQIGGGLADKISLDELKRNTAYYILLKGKENDSYSLKVSYVTHSITYQLNGGKNAVSNPDFYKETSITKIQPANRKGYIFEGWYSDKKMKKKVESISQLQNKKVVLYAKWTKITVPQVNITNVKKKKQLMTVKYKKLSTVKGYQIQYSQKKSFRSSVKKLTRKTVYNVNVKKRKSYYVRVRGV